MSECSGPGCTHSDHKTILQIEGNDGEVIMYGPRANNLLLRTPSKETTLKEVHELNLPARIEYAMRKTWTPALGLSAIQIGVALRFALYYRLWQTPASNTPVFLVNPKIVSRADLVPYPKEGCLSIKDNRPSTWRYNVVRFQHVVDGKVVESIATGIEAFVIQHETDHMDGILCLERQTKPQEPGRNDPCSCGSGKKFKKCCGS